MVNSNFLSPAHRKLEEEEITTLMEKYSINKENLPKIKKDDKGLAELKAEEGDVIEIERESFVGKSKYYRVVEE